MLFLNDQIRNDCMKIDSYFPVVMDSEYSLKSGHSEILRVSFVSIGALYCIFLKH